MFDNCGHMWTSYGRFNNWVALDLGQVRSLTKLNIDAEGTMRAPRNMAIHTSSQSITGPWTRAFVSVQ